MSHVKNIYHISPPVLFEEKPMGERIAPTYWTAYGTKRAREAGLIARIAELSGRLPAHMWHITALRRRAEDERDIHVDENHRILWDGDAGEDGLFKAHELAIVESSSDFLNPTEICVHLDEPFDEECAKRIERLLVVGLNRELGWAILDGGLLSGDKPLDDDKGIVFNINEKALAHAVEVVSCGTRHLDIDIPADTLFRYKCISSFSLAYDRFYDSIDAARMIAKSGCAGEKAFKLEHLLHEMSNARNIWENYVDTSLPLLFIQDLEELADTADTDGIAGFVQSYLVDGVPLEDILA